MGEEDAGGGCGRRMREEDAGGGWGRRSVRERASTLSSLPLFLLPPHVPPSLAHRLLVLLCVVVQGSEGFSQPQGSEGFSQPQTCRSRRLSAPPARSRSSRSFPPRPRPPSLSPPSPAPTRSPRRTAPAPHGTPDPYRLTPSYPYLPTLPTSGCLPLPTRSCILSVWCRSMPSLQLAEQRARYGPMAAQPACTRSSIVRARY
eukprot:179296-Rhodomonas_salina.1